MQYVVEEKFLEIIIACAGKYYEFSTKDDKILKNHVKLYFKTL